VVGLVVVLQLVSSIGEGIACLQTEWHGAGGGCSGDDGKLPLHVAIALHLGIVLGSLFLHSFHPQTRALVRAFLFMHCIFQQVAFDTAPSILFRLFTSHLHVQVVAAMTTTGMLPRTLQQPPVPGDAALQQELPAPTRPLFHTPATKQLLSAPSSAALQVRALALGTR
jgi:hypothetical protein